MTERAPHTGMLRKAGPYTIEREVGNGAAGTVYRAVDETSGEVVALKYVTDPAWRSRFRREVETLARLTHPGIVRYIAHGETRQGLYLAMEWLDGEDLGKCIDRGPIPWPGVRSLGMRLVAALAHAHAEKAVHRDIGPRNIFLPSGRLEQAKLLDFGLVRVPDALDRTASKAVLGTPQYMAPEQVRDPRNVDARTDIFALGVVFFEALSAKRPFDGSDLFTVWNNIVGQPAPNLRQLAPNTPEDFVALIERMLMKDPEKRPQSAQAIHEALVRLDAPATGDLGTAVYIPVGKYTAPMSPVGKEPLGKATAPMDPVKDPKEAVKGTIPMTPRSGPALAPISAPPGSSPSARPSSVRQPNDWTTESSPSRSSVRATTVMSTAPAATAPPKPRKNVLVFVALALGVGVILLALLAITLGRDTTEVRTIEHKGEKK